MRLYQHGGLQGLELWHGLARHSTLYQLREDKASYFAGLSEFLAELHAGKARTAVGTSLGAAGGFEELLLTGGDAEAASAAVAWPHRLVNPGPYAARPGAEAVWRELGWRRPVALDLGQSRLKVLSPQGSAFFDRDESALPFGKDALPAGLGRERLLDLLRPHIPRGCDGVLLALPTALQKDGEAESSTYPGLYGAVEPLFAPLFGETPWVVVNDAVLAARGYPPPPGRKRLVITLGFGVGGALWH